MKDFNTNKDGKRPSASFVVGAVALLFLIVGYQAALFIHKASVARIIANHDEPDTVFVYASENASQAVGVTANERPVASTSSATEPLRSLHFQSPSLSKCRSDRSNYLLLMTI